MIARKSTFNGFLSLVLLLLIFNSCGTEEVIYLDSTENLITKNSKVTELIIKMATNNVKNATFQRKSSQSSLPDCTTFKYPVTFNAYFGDDPSPKEIVVNSDEELLEFFSTTLTPENQYYIYFPVSLIDADGNETIINSLADLETTLQERLDACGVIDADDTDDDGVSDTDEDIDGDGDPSNDDTDGDGTPDYLDNDDDGDGIPTADEDTDGDGDPTNDDTDGDGTPDYSDDDDDGDGIPTADEDTDGDGDPTNDDTDGDGTPDYSDDDDDDDGIPTADEDTNDDGDPTNDDTDGDGTPDYSDDDDDGDGIPTADEDADGDGDPTNDDSDGDGIPDYSDDDDGSDDDENEPHGCNTIFAKGDDSNSSCFLNDGFDRWGWSIGPLEQGDYSFNIYGGAGQCDIEKGDFAGILKVSYHDDTVEVTYEANDGFVFNETHLYVGSAAYPTDNNGSSTVAPGQFPYKHDSLNEAISDSYTVTGMSGDAIYIIAHGSACYTGDDSSDD